MENKNEFKYVFEACTGKIHPATIADLLSVPEFVAELRKFNGSISIQVLFEMSDRVYNEIRPIRNNDDFKGDFIAMHGAEGWIDFTKRYKRLKDGHRKLRNSIE